MIRRLERRGTQNPWNWVRSKKYTSVKTTCDPDRGEDSQDLRCLFGEEKITVTERGGSLQDKE